MNRDVKLALIFIAVITVGVATFSYVSQNVGLKPFKQMNATLTEGLGESPAQSD